VGDGTRGVGPLTGGGVEGGEGGRVTTGQQQIGASDHQRLGCPLVDQRPGWNAVEGADGLLRVARHLGGDGTAQGDQTQSGGVPLVGQDLTPG
jgi:hypothetical protein